MAKKKTVESDGLSGILGSPVGSGDDEDRIDTLFKEISKEFGEGTITKLTDFLDKKKQIIPFSPSLDIGLSGGIPEGCWVTATGAPKTGKTTHLLHFAATCQQPEYGGRDVYYFDIEARFKSMNALGIPKLNKDKFYVIQSTEGNILTAEKFLTAAEKVICTKPGAVVFLDSLSALLTEAEYVGGMSDQQRADQAKMIAKFCRKNAARISVNRIILLAVTHQQANPSGYGAPTQEKSGNAAKFQVDVKIKVKSTKDWESPGLTKPVGSIVKWLIECSALGSPYAEVESYMRYGYGIDELKELIVLSTELGLITKGGAWFTCNFMEKYVEEYDEKKFKFQGQDNLYEFLKDNPEYKDYLYKEFKGLVG